MKTIAFYCFVLSITLPRGSKYRRWMADSSVFLNLLKHSDFKRIFSWPILSAASWWGNLHKRQRLRARTPGCFFSDYEKILIIQISYILLWSHHAKMVTSNFRKTFLLLWHKIRCIVLNKTEKLFVKKKNANHTISIYGKCMTNIFLMATTKIFLYIWNCSQKFFVFFFQPQIDFRTQTNIFWQKKFACKI